MDKRVDTYSKKFYIGYDCQNLYYKNKDGEEKILELSKGPRILFLNPKGISTKGNMEVVIDESVIDLIPFKSGDAKALNTIVPEITEVVAQIINKNNDLDDPDGFQIVGGTKFSNKIYYHAEVKDTLVNLARDLVPSNEIVMIMLKGAFKEYLIVTDKTLYIIKSGYMTGHLVGQGNFSMPLVQISNTSVDFHFASGYFTVSAPGLQNTPKNYWSNDAKTDPAKSPNTISLNKPVKDAFIHATQTINSELIPRLREPKTSETSNNSSLNPADQLRSFKGLLDDGIITQEEFDAKKKQILGL